MRGLKTFKMFQSVAGGFNRVYGSLRDFLREFKMFQDFSRGFRELQ